MDRKKIYFLCTGNSCRSQMAEGYAKQLLDSDKYEIQSAGVEVHGMNPLAVQVMAEDAVDISTQYSKILNQKYFAEANLIVTLCGDARDKCPAISAGTNHIHWDLLDPAQASGSQEQILNVFRSVREEIKSRMVDLAASLN